MHFQLAARAAQAIAALTFLVVATLQWKGEREGWAWWTLFGNAWVICAAFAAEVLYLIRERQRAAAAEEAEALAAGHTAVQGLGERLAGAAVGGFRVATRETGVAVDENPIQRAFDRVYGGHHLAIVAVGYREEADGESAAAHVACVLHDQPFANEAQAIGDARVALDKALTGYLEGRPGALEEGR